MAPNAIHAARFPEQHASRGAAGAHPTARHKLNMPRQRIADQTSRPLRPGIARRALRTLNACLATLARPTCGPVSPTDPVTPLTPVSPRGRYNRAARFDPVNRRRRSALNAGVAPVPVRPCARYDRQPGGALAPSHPAARSCHPARSHQDTDDAGLAADARSALWPSVTNHAGGALRTTRHPPARRSTRDARLTAHAGVPTARPTLRPGVPGAPCTPVSPRLPVRPCGPFANRPVHLDAGLTRGPVYPPPGRTWRADASLTTNAGAALRPSVADKAGGALRPVTPRGPVYPTGPV